MEGEGGGGSLSFFPSPPKKKFFFREVLTKMDAANAILPQNPNKKKKIELS